MARPQKFDQQVVLNDAMLLFWRQGFGGTSIKDLTEITGLQPGSLYGTFKNKRSLFLQAMEHYFFSLYTTVTTLLNSDAPPLERIRGFFDYLLKQAAEDDEAKGCLLINTLLETSPCDVEINQRISVMLKKIEDEFCQVLWQAKENGEIPADKNPEILASLLMTGIFGLRVYDRVQTSPSVKKDVVKNLLSILTSK